MSRIQRFFLYDEGDPTIDDFLKLSPEQVLTFADHVDLHGFEGTTEELLSLARKLELSYEKTTDLMQFAGYLQNERARLKLGVEGLVEEFEIYLERRKIDIPLTSKLRSLSEPLKKLFADRPQIALRTKAATVTAGVMPQASDFWSIVDLRPIFNEERDTILEYATVALVRILLRTETREDSTVVFQIDPQGVSRLEQFLDRLKRKMAVLESVRSGLTVGERK
jgi:hypothetical protein